LLSKLRFEWLIMWILLNNFWDLNIFVDKSSSMFSSIWFIYNIGILTLILQVIYFSKILIFLFLCIILEGDSLFQMSKRKTKNPFKNVEHLTFFERIVYHKEEVFFTSNISENTDYSIILTLLINLKGSKNFFNWRYKDIG